LHDRLWNTAPQLGAKRKQASSPYMNTDAGRRWGSSDRPEGFVRDWLTHYPHFFKIHAEDDLPLMKVTIPGQFNASGHGIDIIAVDHQ
jgi:hypothetical protein